MSKLLYTRFTKLIIDYFLSRNKNIPRISDTELHSEGDDSPLTKLSNTVKGDYEANIPKVFKKDVVPRKIRSLTIVEETISVELAKSISIKEQRTQQRQRSQLIIDRQVDNDVEDTLERLRKKKQVVADKGLSAAYTKYNDTSDTESDATHYSLCSDISQESANETNVADDSNMDLTDDEPKGDDDTTRYMVFIYNKFTKMPKSTYFSTTITSSFLDFIQNLLDETPVNKLIDLMSNPVYTNAHTSSTMHNPKQNHEVISFLSGAFEVPYGTYVDVQATNLVFQDMFSNNVAHHISSPPATITYKLPTNPQPNSLQAKAKKLIQKAKKNIRKINFKKKVAHKFREYD
ncbi:hypothetical protein Tco_1037808 [Tanacetum coccineum]